MTIESQSEGTRQRLQRQDKTNYLLTFDAKPLLVGPIKGYNIDYKNIYFHSYKTSA